MIPIYKPYLPKKSLEYAHDAVTSTWISSQGEYLERVTDKLKTLLKAPHVQLVNTGTAATHLVARGLLHKHPTVRKLFVPNNVYVAAWNPFCYDRKLELVPVDADINTWNFDIRELKNKIEDNCAVLAVHNIGNIINVPKLREELPPSTVFLEDSCEGFMGTYDNKYAGTQSLLASFSFFGNKIITSGEGGAVVTDDKEVFEFINILQGQGQSKDTKYLHVELGYNYRMTNVQAALLLGQLEELSVILKRKKNIFSYYRKELSAIESVTLQQVEKNTIHSNWMMGIRIKGNPSSEKICRFLKDKGIDSRPMFYPMSFHKHLKLYANPHNERVATLLSKECVILPSFPDLSVEECEYIVNSIKEYVLS